MRSIFYLIFFTILTLNSFSQQIYTQNIRGVVVDKQNRSPLPGATVIVSNTDPVIGTSTNEKGEFRLENLPIGRVSLEVSFLGYNTRTLQNLLLNSAKELILTIELEEKVYLSDEIVIKADVDKSRAFNKMATVSARSFSVEETNKYAGSLGDPSRMVANFAGVRTVDDTRNDIIIRGNSPLGLLWRLEGVEIPNPNHFGAMGTTGGPVSILNNNLLANSDFLTGAFPAEFGNVLSGVFDLKMRAGNNEKCEYTGQIGFNGFELGAEGPFSSKYKGSYLINYRYSVPALFNLFAASSSAAGSSVPYYQDLTLKIDAPTEKYGKFSLFALGGKSTIKIYDSEKDTNEFSFGLKGTNLDFGSEMAAIGVTNSYFINQDNRIFTTISFGYNNSFTKIDSISQVKKDSIFPWYRSDLGEYKYSVSSQWNKKYNTKNFLQTGFVVDLFKVSYIDKNIENGKNDYTFRLNENGILTLYRAYSQLKHRLNDVMFWTGGIHTMFVPMNNSYAIEPRLGYSWQYHPLHTLNVGTGLYSQLQPHIVYFFNTKLPSGLSSQTNRDLGLTKSYQVVIGDDYSLGKSFRIKTEVYYQYLYNVPISPKEQQFSMVNEGGYFAINLNDSLQNKGTSENIGLELTIEKFLSSGYYFLATASIFDSKYRGWDGITRNTAFNGNYVFNALGGYEFKVGNKGTIGLDIKSVWAGGKRYVPVDIPKTIEEHKTVFEVNKSYESKYGDYIKIDFRISYRRNGNRITQEWAIDLKNITNQMNVFAESYSPKTKSIQTDYQQGFNSMFLYRINF